MPLSLYGKDKKSVFGDNARVKMGERWEVWGERWEVLGWNFAEKQPAMPWKRLKIKIFRRIWAKFLHKWKKKSNFVRWIVVLYENEGNAMETSMQCNTNGHAIEHAQRVQKG